jgi:hypothetical protein
LKYKIPVVLALVVLSVAMALAQTSPSTSTPVVFGQGSSNFIPIWTGGSTLGNSVMFQSGGNVGVGTTSPQATLDVDGSGVFGIRGVTSSTADSATGVRGDATATTGTNNGVLGVSAGPTGVGVSGNATSLDGGTGVYGQTVSPHGVGVSGASLATTGNAPGVFGQTASTEFGAGVNGNAIATTGNSFGVFGRSNSTGGNGVFGYASSPSGNTTGVVGLVESPNGTAGRFVSNSGSGLLLQGNSGSTQVFAVDATGNGFLAGNLVVTGTVSKGGGSFKIDHPLDPSNKTLSHSFVESPDMMNIYNGVANLDAKGQASVSLPDWFESLNGDYRYLLTAIGAPQPELYIAEEIHGNRFKIAGGKPGAKVSWQVTGIRHDAYANAHRIRVEEDKPAAERGSYIHPEALRTQEIKGLTNARQR